MKLEPCIILKLFLNFRASEPLYSHELYSYIENMCTPFKILSIPFWGGHEWGNLPDRALGR